MQAYILKRILLFIPTILLVTVMVFVLLRIVPGDPALLILQGDDENTIETFTQQELSALRAELGTDRNIIVQYGDWMSGMLRADFGTSLFNQKAVWPQLQRRIPITLELSLMSILISSTVAIPLGAISAIRQDTWGDYAARVISLIGLATPNFWVAVMTIMFLVIVFNWFPPLGYENVWVDPGTNLSQLIWPALALGTSGMAFQARVTRSSMLEILHEDYVRTARAKGLGERVVVTRHALRNALLPVVTLIGLSVGGAISGSVIIETIFLVPGMGRYLIVAINNRDYPITQAIVVLFAVMVLMANLVTDIAYAWLDPRIRYA
ncbi:MAG: hypothetical protein BZY81_04965 [SAR202 cluster bacterium Io17-Chloro-G4]|nr:MAG: hypothetical protein BZY81_04965 [SAR202 cluster bacterium Io17-Chloro-G4]